MARFRLLVIISAIWLTFIFNLERPDFEFIGLGNIDLDTVVYITAAIAALAALWLPDVSRRTEYVFIPALALYLTLKLTISNFTESNIAFIVFEIAVLYVTVILFRRISIALLSFEQTVENVLLQPDSLRVMSMEQGEERIEEEFSRARRFDRVVGVILISTHPLNQPAGDQTYRFDLERQLQKHYLQLRVAQIAELVLYKVDLIMLHKRDVLVCMPETAPHIVERKRKELVEEIRWRLGIDVVAGMAMFPEDGFIYRDVVDKATVHMYREEEAYRQRQQPDDDHDPNDPPHGGHRADRDGEDETEAREDVPIKLNNPARVERLLPEQSFQVLYPWPDVILRYQSNENYGRRNDSERDALFNPNSWIGALPYQSNTSRRLYVLLKRVLDMLLVLIAMPFAAPVMGLVALAIWLEDRGPIFFVQERTGFGGKRFKMFKFRTMVPDAEEKLKELAAQGMAKLDENGKLAEPLKLKRDPRITRVGRILRKTSLDELPQLLNVLKGDMSLVGPRPTSWSTTSYRLFHTERLQVRPGITGLWQVAARGTTNFDEWVDWDRTYVDKMCLSLDIQIFVRTFLKVFQQRGAR